MATLPQSNQRASRNPYRWEENAPVTDSLVCWFNKTGTTLVSDNVQDALIELFNKIGTSGPAGANTQIQFNNSGVFGASAGLTWTILGNRLNATNILSSGNITATTTLIGGAPVGTSGDNCKVKSALKIGTEGGIVTIAPDNPNIRGSQAVDLQFNRSAVDQVAAANFSVIIGGDQSKITPLASETMILNGRGCTINSATLNGIFSAENININTGCTNDIAIGGTNCNITNSNNSGDICSTTSVYNSTHPSKTVCYSSIFNSINCNMTADANLGTITPSDVAFANTMSASWISTILNSRYTSIVSSAASTINNATRCAIINGDSSQIINTFADQSSCIENLIAGGVSNVIATSAGITTTNASTILGGGGNHIYGSYGTIINAQNSTISSTSLAGNNIIIGGNTNVITGLSTNNTVINGLNGTITNSDNSIYMSVVNTTSHTGLSQSVVFDMAGGVGGFYINNITTSAIAGTVLHMDGSNKVFKFTSSERYKENIENIEIDTSKIYDLTAKSFDDKTSKIRTFGMIAEEVNEILPELVVKNTENQPESISYQMLSVLLLEEVKKLKYRLDKIEGIKPVGKTATKPNKNVNIDVTVVKEANKTKKGLFSKFKKILGV